MTKSHVKTNDEIEIMAEGGQILKAVMSRLVNEAKIGQRLIYLDQLAKRLIKKAGAEPAFLGYRPDGAMKPFPNSVCLSINEVVVHGRPNHYQLQSGDVLKIDLGVRYRGFCTDAAITIGIGSISHEAIDLIAATKESLENGVKQAVVGKTLGDIGFAIERYIKNRGFKIIRGLTGHGIGEKLHEDPAVYNWGKPSSGPRLENGWVLAIEPMTGVNTADIFQLKDDSYATEDGSLSAHFEHTVAILNNGPRILT